MPKIQKGCFKVKNEKYKKEMKQFTNNVMKKRVIKKSVKKTKNA